MSPDRLLPDDKTLENGARYKAQLSRLFHKAFHDLEAYRPGDRAVLRP
jgi:hypothetical protein